MAPVPRNFPQQFSHAHPNHNHPLMHHSDDQGYVCHGCKTSGFGDRFRCHACTVDMHVYCADCPRELSCAVHNHRLALVVRKAQGARLNHRICDICRESIDGLFYRCKDCDFDVHPLCTQLPEELRHVIDDTHKLKLQKLSSRTASCAVCKTDCSSLWVYGCGACRVNVHLRCLLKPVPPSGSRGIPYAPPPWTTGQPPFNGGSFPWNGEFFGGPFQYGYGAFVNPNVDYGGHSYGYVPPWGFPNYYGSVPFAHNNPCPRPNHGAHTPPSPSRASSSIWGSMFSLVGNLAVGAMTNFLFGSTGL